MTLSNQSRSLTQLNSVFDIPAGAPGGGWANAPTNVPKDCPKGLEYLAQVDQLLVKQKVEGLEG